MTDLTYKDVMDLFHNRHETLEVSERKRILSFCSVVVDEDVENFIFKMECSELLIVIGEYRKFVVAWNKFYRIPISSEIRQKYLLRKQENERYIGADLASIAFDEILKGNLEGYVEKETPAEFVRIM